MNKIFLLSGLILLISGCSNRAMYENLQSREHQKCVEESTVHIKDCEQYKETSYEEYARAREEELNQKNANQ